MIDDALIEKYEEIKFKYKEYLKEKTKISLVIVNG